MCLIHPLPAAFWLSWMTIEVLASVVFTLLLIGFGAMFGFAFFTVNSFAIVFTLFFVFQVGGRVGWVGACGECVNCSVLRASQQGGGCVHGSGGLHPRRGWAPCVSPHAACAPSLFSCRKVRRCLTRCPAPLTTLTHPTLPLADRHGQRGLLALQ